MTENMQSAKMWEGRVVDATFPLQRLLGETNHSAVFLTEYTDGATKEKAAIKLVGAEAVAAELQLASWNYAAHMPHANLLRLFKCGRCSLDGNDLLYVVMELAEENLADILPQRALTAEETRDMLLPVLDALEFLHGKGLVHRDIKPANILASGDQLKLSSDAITRVGEGLSVPKQTSVYDPPEAVSGVLSPAGDVWALGTTLVEVLTQRLPEWQPGPHREPVIPANLPAPFLDIARHCLRLEPDRRMRIADIAARLNPRAAAAAASAAVARTAVDQVSVAGLKPESRARLATTPKPSIPVPITPRDATRVPAPPVRPETYGAPSPRPRFIIPLIIGALIFAVILTVPRLLTKRPTVAPRAPETPTSSTPSETSAPSADTTAATKSPTRSDRKSSSRAAVPENSAAMNSAASAENLKTAGEKVSPAPVAAAPAVSRSEVPANAASSGRPGKGEVLDQVLPEVSQKARDTIQGSVRVSVKVHVDSAGAVSGAELDSAGPSKYFADVALQAARRWAFTPPEVAGKSVESDWLLRFVFTQTDTKVTPTQTAP